MTPGNKKGVLRKVLPAPDRYPQDRDMLLLQDTLKSIVSVHTSPYDIISGMQATLSGAIIYISQGIIWSGIDGHYISVPGTRLTVPGDGLPHRLGLQVAEGVMGAGYDPILGGIAPPLWEPPLDREVVCIRYVWDETDMLPVLTVKEGSIYHYKRTGMLPRDYTTIRTYMRELDGDYIVWGISISSIEGWVHVGKGKVWIAGTPIEVQAQSIPYKDGALALCSDGRIAIQNIKGGDPLLNPSYITTQIDTAMVMGMGYVVTLPYITYRDPYVTDNVYSCMYIASLEGGIVTDIAPRLIDVEQLLRLVGPTPSSISIELGDIYHPLYKARVVPNRPNGTNVPLGVIYLPRIAIQVKVNGYIVPNSNAVLEQSEVRTDWIDSSPTPSTPPPPPPFMYIESTPDNTYKVRAYNLLPDTVYIPNPFPLRVIVGTLTSPNIKADSTGALEYVTSTPPVELSGIVPSDYPDVSVGLGQGFYIERGVMVSGVSLYLRAGYYGVISICPMSVVGVSTPTLMPPLAWVPVSTTSIGWTYISLGPIYLQPGTYAIVSQSVVGSIMARRHYLLPNLVQSAPQETSGSMSMLLSQAGTWQSLPNMDLTYRLHSSTPIEGSLYADRVLEIEWPEPFDGYEYEPDYLLPPGTYITCTANSGGTLVGKVFPPTTKLSITEALFGTPTLYPVIRDNNVTLYITSKEGTWVSRESLVNTYTSVRVTFNAYIPEGSSVVVSIAGGSNGWLPLTVEQVLEDKYTYYIENLSPTTVMTDINNQPRQVLRDRVRIRIDLKTVSPHIQPHVWGVTFSTSYG
jgi:hypothetical protein